MECVAILTFLSCSTLLESFIWRSITNINMQKFCLIKVYPYICLMKKIEIKETADGFQVFDSENSYILKPWSNLKKGDMAQKHLLSTMRKMTVHCL